MSKNVAFMLFALLALSSLVMVCSVSAQSIPKPSVPEFSIKIVSAPYDVAPSIAITIDPYTGEETVITEPGYHVENKTTQIWIKNQPFTPYELQENDGRRIINLHYNIRLKGHFSQDWRYYRLHNGSSDGNLRQNYHSEYTVVPIDSYLPSSGKIDFQIEALMGYERGIVTYPGVPGTQRIILGESSGWSDVVTFNIGESQVSSPNQTPTPSPEPTVPTPTPIQTPYGEPSQTDNFGPISVVIAFGAVFAFGLILLYRIKRK